jgi:predicted MFS family arabinose efflux permease
MSPMWVDSLGFQYKGFFNFSFILSSIAMRIFAGRRADRWGRERSILVGFILLIIGVTTIGFANSQFTVLLGGLIYGLSIGINKPSIFAWTADLSSPGKIGMALATMLLALEIGIGSGSFISGAMYAGEVEMIPYTFWLAAALSVFGLVYIYLFRKRQIAHKS